MAAILPYELIQSQVLPRLPAKSVGRFRCVCKAWNSFSSTPNFSRMHLLYQNTNKLLFFDYPSGTFRTLDCEPENHGSLTTLCIPFNEKVFLLASLDGLVCVALEETRQLAFWNPLTGAYKTIRTSFYDDIRISNICNAAFAFYIDSSNDYRLLHLDTEGVFIYSLRLDSWRKVNVPLESRKMLDFKWLLATFFGGKVYFKLKRGSTWCIMSFDVEYEKFKEIELPPLSCNVDVMGVSLVALNGCIQLCVGYGDVSPKGMKCDMWRMDGDEWVRMLTFRSPFWNIYKDIYTKKNGNWLAIWKFGNRVKSIGLEYFATDYICYHGAHLYPGAIYTETLVSPDP